MEKRRNNNNKRKWSLAAGAVVLLLLGLGIYRFVNRDIVTVRVENVKIGPIESIVSAGGTVNAPVYELGTKMGGKIGEWRVKEGTAVKRGQILATFDNFTQASNDYTRTKSLYDGGAASSQAYDAARVAYEAAKIVAPSNGIVAKINFDEGETVVPGQTAVIVVNNDRKWIGAQIDEIDIAEVRAGHKVKVTTDVYPDRIYEGEIYWISPIAELRQVGGRVKMDEESYVFPCRIRLKGRHNELKTNMSIMVDIATKKNDKALIVPREALFSRDDMPHVYVIKNNRSHLTHIDIGIRSFISVEAVSGLAEGDEMAITSVSKLKDKGRVRIER